MWPKNLGNFYELREKSSHITSSFPFNGIKLKVEVKSNWRDLHNITVSAIFYIIFIFRIKTTFAGSILSK